MLNVYVEAAVDVRGDERLAQIAAGAGRPRPDQQDRRPPCRLSNCARIDERCRSETLALPHAGPMLIVEALFVNQPVVERS